MVEKWLQTIARNEVLINLCNKLKHLSNERSVNKSQRHWEQGDLAILMPLEIILVVLIDDHWTIVYCWMHRYNHWLSKWGQGQELGQGLFSHSTSTLDAFRYTWIYTTNTLSFFLKQTKTINKIIIILNISYKKKLRWELFIHAGNLLR